MPKQSPYTFEQLVEVYRRYAQLKGWSTKEEVIRDKVESWIDHSIGPVGLAIEYHETRQDGAKHLGHDAEARAADAPIQTISTQVAGVEHANGDGPARGASVKKCPLFDLPPPRHEPQNKYDSNAIAVLRADGEQIGYLPRRVAAEFVGEAKLGCRYVAALESIDTFGGMAGVIPDVTILVFRAKPSVSDKELQGYYNAWVGKMLRIDGGVPR